MVQQPGGSGSPDPIARVNDWHRQAVERPPGTPDYGDKVDRFSGDFGSISKLDGSKPYASAFGVFAGDQDAAPGSVEVPGVGSLKRTAEGFTLGVLRQGLYGLPVGWATYRVNTEAHTIKATETSLPYYGGYFVSPGGTTSYTLHTDTQSLTDYQQSPLIDSPPGRENPMPHRPEQFPPG
ncbi:MAG: hypothetical protein HY319_27730 [Armatimonadetes bacterium]|nr:hypothetical protein [Armatimonadota bacterium]